MTPEEVRLYKYFIEDIAESVIEALEQLAIDLEDLNSPTQDTE